MDKNLNALGRAMATAMLASLAACGGGGGGSGGFALPVGSAPTGTTTTSTTPANTTTPQTDTSTPAAAKLSGVAATGAAFSGATVTVVDQTGATVCSTQTDANGAYACDLPASAKAPFVITARRDDQTLYSTTASTGGTANVTPLTTIIVSRLSPDGNPASLAGAIQSRPDTVTATTVSQQVSDLVAALKPLLGALGDSIDPISGSFSADGTGHDRVLDAISVSVRPDGSGANIEVTVKTVPNGDEGAPVSISFRSSDPTLATLPAVNAEHLVQASTSQLVAAFFERMNACYALPLTQRVATASNDSTAATGGPADVSAPACRGLFVNDDPASFRSNGSTVGRDSRNNGAFAGLFRPGATGLKNDRGTFEFFRSNGDLVLSYRWVDTTGNTDYDTIVVRNAGGTLKASGNGYAYGARVNPIVQDRDLLNTPAFSYITTGYNINIANRVDGSGNPVFTKVLATTPFGNTVEYRPSAGSSFLVVVKNGNLTGTPQVRLAGAYRNAATAGNPADKEANQYFLSPQYTDEQLRALPDQSVWKLEFFLVDGSPNVVQTYRTVSRAPTLGEVRQIRFADATPALRADIVSGSAATGYIVFGAPSAGDPNLVDFSADGNLDGWTVPDGALAPTSLTAYGRTGAGVRFNDGITVRNTLRKAIVTCTPQSQGDAHCDSGTGVLQYAQGTRLDGFELWARSNRQVELSKFLALYKLQ